MSAPANHQSRFVELATVSFLILFLELALIRWVSTEIRIFAYVNNLVLLACFLGIGIGCYYSNRKIRLNVSLIAFGLLFILLTAPLRITFEGHLLHLIKDTPTLLSAFSDSPIWFESRPTDILFKATIGMTSTLVIFSLIVTIFVSLGQILGHTLTSYGNLIAAYSWNVAASLAGIWCFNGLSFCYAPPWVWFLLMAPAVFILLRRYPANRGASVLGTAMLIVLMLMPLMNSAHTVWSPYQKLQVSRLYPAASESEYIVTVNNATYMMLFNLSDSYLRQRYERVDLQSMRLNQYEIPYRFKLQPKEVLIVGAGGGNDTAGALRSGAQHVTAVEIDPGIYNLGERFHPEKPYSNRRVEVVIDDARSFFKKTDQRYDVISFGFLDAHTLTSSYNNVRIDHYVYTRESFAEARNLLADDGILALNFDVQRWWIAARLYNLLHEAFGEDPVAFRVYPESHHVGMGGVMFIISKNMERIRNVIAEDSALKDFIAANRFYPRAPVKLTTDDWPYLYLKGPSIPSLHLLLSLLLIALFVGVKRVMVRQNERIEWHFFFLGAAFLLLEFQNISKTTLLFGSTWIVNSIVISAILILTLLANLVVAQVKKLPIRLIYAALLVSILVTFLLPVSLFNAFPFIPRIIIASIVLNMPIFFGGMVFITSFSKAARPNAAFGSNLVGAGFGGILESVSFVTGISSLLLLVGLFYIMSLVVLENKGKS